MPHFEKLIKPWFYGLLVAVLVLAVVLFSSLRSTLIASSSSSHERTNNHDMATTSGAHETVFREEVVVLPVHKDNGNVPQLQTTPIHIVLCADSTLLNALLALIQSIKVHNKLNNIVIHIIVSRKNKILIRNTLHCSIEPVPFMQVNIIAFELPSEFKSLLRSVGKKNKYYSYLAKESNFARFFIGKLFPSLSHVLYIDSDTLVLHDLNKLWEEVINNDKLLLAVPRRYSNIHFKFRNIESYFYAKYGKKYMPSKYDFNAGVVGFNLNKWRVNNVLEDVKYWMEQNSRHSLWGLGTQPIMHLISYNDWKGADLQWNVHAYGSIERETFDAAYLVHFNGKVNKPWNIIPAIKWSYAFSVWLKYYQQVHVCSYGTGTAEGTVIQELSASVIM